MCVEGVIHIWPGIPVSKVQVSKVVLVLGYKKDVNVCCYMPEEGCCMLRELRMFNRLHCGV